MERLSSSMGNMWSNDHRLFDLSGQTAVVTGAATGIGLCITQGLTVQGAQVVLVDIDAAAAVGAAEAIVRGGGAAVAIHADVRRAEAAADIVDAAFATFGSLDILVNNVGGTVGSNVPAEDVALSDWEATLELNATSTFICSQHVGRAMIAQERGRIINIASLYALVGQVPSLYDAHPDGRSFQLLAYSAAKGAVVAMTRALAVAWAHAGVTVNAVVPGQVRTERNTSMASPVFWERISERTPLGRPSEPRDVAGAAIYLASREAAFVTGQVLVVDGGWAAV